MVCVSMRYVVCVGGEWMDECMCVWWGGEVCEWCLCSVWCVWWGVCEWCVSLQYVNGWMGVCVCGGADAGCVTCREAIVGEGLSPRAR